MMSQRRVVCTGNPDRFGTLASGFKKLFPGAVFLCKGTGWELQSQDAVQIQRLHDVFSACNTFLNCSYIAPHIQSNLLDICHGAVKYCDVVNIGSTHEYDGQGSEPYRTSKLELREKSLSYNSFRFRTCHFVLGGIKKDDSRLKQDWLDIDIICREVVRIWTLPYQVPLTSMDQNKQPW